MLKIKRALISVSDKTGLLDLAKTLIKFGVEIISTGGTYKYLSENKIPVISISTVTGFPEILDGRVKTLHPNIHAGILAILEDQKHLDDIKKLGIKPIELVCVNLYPFEETVKKNDISNEEKIENIDIGGPSLLRAASKNYKYTAAVSDPIQYSGLIEELNNNDGSLSEDTLFNLAKEVFRVTSYYDSLIFEYFNSKKSDIEFPNIISISARKEMNLRYGENPHQKSSLYGKFGDVFKSLHGKELSYNNILDISSGVSLLQEFEEPAAVILKHNNPCGAAIGDTLYHAYNSAFETDKKSAFGGIIAVNKVLDRKTAEYINEIFCEVIVAPEIPEDVLEFLKSKKDRRLVIFDEHKIKPEKFQIRNVIGGYLLQDIDKQMVKESELSFVTKRLPTESEIKAMLFGWKIVKHTKSNAIIFCNENRTLGIGAGQMSRVDAARIAIMKAIDSELSLDGSTVASDAFFPFADSLIEAVKVGAKSVIQPGGSIRDPQVIEAANNYDVAMSFTGMRHFKH